MQIDRRDFRNICIAQSFSVRSNPANQAVSTLGGNSSVALAPICSRSTSERDVPLNFTATNRLLGAVAFMPN